MTDHIGVYRGWTVTYDKHRPVTSVWRAERHGVGMNAGDRPALFNMIDAKVEEPAMTERETRKWLHSIGLKGVRLPKVEHVYIVVEDSTVQCLWRVIRLSSGFRVERLEP